MPIAEIVEDAQKSAEGAGTVVLLFSLCAASIVGPDAGSTRLLAQSPSLTPGRKLLPSAVRIDDAAVAAKQKAALAWNLGILVGAYDVIGSRNPKWDADARRGLTMTARIWADDPTRPGDSGDQAWYAFRRAVKAGCDDPLVQYLDVRFSSDDQTSLDEAHATYGAMLKLVPSRYHAYLKSRALVASAQTLADASHGIAQKEWEPRGCGLRRPRPPGPLRSA